MGYSISKLILQDEIGKISTGLNQSIRIFWKVLRNVNGASEWCDIKQTERVETCEDISVNALDNALIVIANKYGNDAENGYGVIFIKLFLQMM